MSQSWNELLRHWRSGLTSTYFFYLNCSQNVPRLHQAIHAHRNCNYHTVSAECRLSSKIFNNLKSMTRIYQFVLDDEDFPRASRTTPGPCHCSLGHIALRDIWRCFLADHTNGRTIGTLLRTSVLSSVTLCIVVYSSSYSKVTKALLTAYRKSYLRNRLVPKWMTLTFEFFV